MRRYLNIATTKVDKKTVYSTTRYPEIPLRESDIYVYTSIGDRYDILAQQYYKDSTYWWVISAANPAQGFQGLTIQPGQQIRIPTSYVEAEQLFNTLNAQ